MVPTHKLNQQLLQKEMHSFEFILKDVYQQLQPSMAKTTNS